MAILDFIFDDDKADTINYRYVVKLTDIETQKIFYDKLTFIYLEMPKFMKKGKELVTHFDKWMYALKWLPSLVESPDFLEEEIFKKLFQISAVQNLSPEEKEKYENSLKFYRDTKNVIDTAREEGKIEGEAIGLEKGKLEGKLEKSRATLRSLLQKKFKVVLSDEINQKIETAELDILDRWIENIFDAESIEGLLK